MKEIESPDRCCGVHVICGRASIAGMARLEGERI